MQQTNRPARPRLTESSHTSSAAQTAMDIRVPPQSMEAEQGALGAMLLERSAIERAVELIQEDDFYRDSHKILFRAIKTLKEKRQPVDLITLGEWLKTTDNLEAIGGTLYLTTLMTSCPTAAGIEHYCKIIKAKALQRNLIKAAYGIIESAHTNNTTDINDLLQNAVAEVMVVQESARPQDDIPINPLWQLEWNVVKAMQDEDESGEIVGLKTLMPSLDNFIDPIQETDFVIVAGRPSAGKTVLGFQIGKNIARQGKTVLFISVEMGERAVAKRALYAEASVPADNAKHMNFRKAHHDLVYEPMMAAIDRDQYIPFYVAKPNICTPNDVEKLARRCKQRHGLGAIVIDYLQLMQANDRTNDAYLKATQISTDLKNLAGRLKVPIICISQLSRSVESRAQKRPMMSDLRDSGKLEEDADLILLLYRPGYYPDNDWAENRSAGIAPGDDRTTEIIIAKQRMGVAGVSAQVYMNKEMSRFDEISERKDAPHQ